MNFAILPCLAVLFVGATAAAVGDKCHFENINNCGTPLSEFRKELGQRFPTSEDQIVRLCEELDEAEGCLNRFKDSCMTPMQLQIMGFVTEGAYDVYREFCRSGSEIRTNYLKNAECMNEAYQSDEYKELASYIEAGLEDLHEKPNTQRLPAACCGYHYMDMHSRQLGTEKCGADAVDAFQKVVTMAASTLPDVMCNGFDPESDQCTSLLPPPGTKPKGTLKDSHLAQSFSALYL